MGPLVTEQAVTLIEKAPDYLEALVSKYGIRLDDLTNQTDTLVEGLQNNPKSILGFIKSVIGTTTNMILCSVLIPAYFFI